MNNRADGKAIIYPELSFKIMELVFEVHNQLGPGFTEDIYEEALICELERNQIAYKHQEFIDVMYKGKKLGVYRLDLIIEDKIIVELKAVSSLNDIFKQQLVSYLKATGVHLGILINFGSKRVEYVRIANG